MIYYAKYSISYLPSDTFIRFVSTSIHFSTTTKLYEIIRVAYRLYFDENALENDN